MCVMKKWTYIRLHYIIEFSLSLSLIYLLDISMYTNVQNKNNYKLVCVCVFVGNPYDFIVKNFGNNLPLIILHSGKLNILK